MGLRYVLVFTLVLLLVLFCFQVDGGRRGGGRSRSSSGSSWGSSSSRSSSSSGKSKSRMKSNLKKAAVVGAGVYVGYQIGKATSRFGSYHHSGQWGYNDYNRWRQQDGMLCRSTLDCAWMDPHMLCQDYELDFSMNRGWFGGDYLAIVGECECRRGYDWDNWELQCEPLFLGIGVAGILMVLAMGMCCCGGTAGLVYWFRNR